MAIFDWIIIGILGISVLISIRRGFVKETLSLATWIAAVVVARLFAGHLSVLVGTQIESESVSLAASYLILFVGTLVVGGVVNFVMGEFVKVTGFTGTDRFFGIFFGLARGTLIVLLVVAGLHYLAPVEKYEWYQQSQIVPEIIKVIEMLGPILWEHGENLIQKSQEQQIIKQSS